MPPPDETTAALGPALLKVLAPLAAIALAFVIPVRRKRPVREELALRRPPLGATLLWWAIYVALMLVSNAFMHWRGEWDFTVWRTSPLAVSSMRVLGVGILGPIAEELMFRGLFLSMLSRTKFGARRGVVLLAVAWAALHVSYGIDVIALIAVGGILLGAARLRTKSVIPPILMHVTWNLYAVW